MMFNEPEPVTEQPSGSYEDYDNSNNYSQS